MRLIEFRPKSSVDVARTARAFSSLAQSLPQDSTVARWDAVRASSLLLASLLLIGLTGCGPKAAPLPKAPLPSAVADPTIAEIPVVRANIERDMFDPWSARFRNVERVPITSGGRPVPAAWVVYVYCGEVNAKNQFGAYVGFRHFMSFPLALKPDQPVDIEDPATHYHSIGWDVFCKGQSGTPVQF